MSLLGGPAKALAEVCIVTFALGYPGEGCGAWCGALARTAAVGATSTGVSTPVTQIGMDGCSRIKTLLHKLSLIILFFHVRGKPTRGNKENGIKRISPTVKT